MDIKTAYEMVKNDDAQPLFTEADQWNSMAGALKLQAMSLKHQIDSYESGLDSDSGRAYVEALKERHKRLDEAATVAATNSTAWRGVAQLVQDNKNAIVKSHQDWETEKNKPENKGKTEAELESIRWPYDVVATAAMDTAVTGVAVKAETMKPPDEYQPMPDISGASSTVDSAPGTTSPNGTSVGTERV